VGQYKLGIKLDGLLVFFDRLVQLLLVAQGVAQVVVGPCKLGIKLDGLAVLLDRPLQVILEGKSMAQVTVGNGTVGSNNQRRMVVSGLLGRRILRTTAPSVSD